jgi:hypothetical protein
VTSGPATSKPPSTVERAWVVAAVRALGARAEAACARRWPDSPSLGALALELAGDPARLAAEAERLDRARPVGLEAIHPSWYEAPPVSSRADAQAWLDRRAYGALVDMTPPEGAKVPALERLDRLDAGAILDRIERLGRRRVATAFLSASRAQIAQLCARLGEPHASQLLDELGQVSQSAAREEVRAARKSLLHVDATLTVEGSASTTESGPPAQGRALFLRAGCVWLGPAVAARGGDRLRQLAQRLPRSAGAGLLAAGALPASDVDNAGALALIGLMASERAGA